MSLLNAYGITHTFSEGENIIEFTPEKTGTVPYTCWMGMIRGNIFVTDGTGETPEVSDTQPDTGISGFGGSGMRLLWRRFLICFQMVLAEK